MSHGYIAIGPKGEKFLSFIPNNPHVAAGWKYYHLVPANDGDEVIGYVNHKLHDARGFLHYDLVNAQESNKELRLDMPDGKWIVTAVKQGDPL